ncbi:ABC transporter ATP-binding protein [Saxibacter everestensis]|uniref:ABC transporter ATP-binding protein n=1 Tax=Saxibacter everestensis TaxID=2909229 RepID=A0ABY8QT39_9MICO|nr:ABC transporter ATP-binding protein [Brevibacteriaceae bacterium ZFBP1038]
MPDLIVEGLRVEFNGQAAVKDVSFTVNDGEFFTLLGPSGCGKTTTLSSIAGLEKPSGGVIRVGSEVFVDAARHRFLTPEERNLGMVFQSYALWPHMTVEANLAMPLKIRKVARAEQDARIGDALDQVGLLPYRKRYPHELSGGQQQRVALARALVYSPKVLLLDEPLSNLDAKLRDRARAWLKDLQQSVGITTIYVTHDQLEALSLSDRLAVMGEGEMLQVGTPNEIYDHPSSLAVADFIGRCSFFRAQVLENENGTLVVDLLDGKGAIRVQSDQQFARGTSVTVGVRSELLKVTPPRTDVPAISVNAIPAELKKVSYVGARYEFELMAAGQLMFAEGDRKLTDDQVWLTVPAEGVFVFAEEIPKEKLANDPVAEVVS